ncbi:Hpt domain protein [compost metagenome]
MLDMDHLQRLVGKDEAALKALLGDLRTSNREDLQRLERVAEDTLELAQLAHRVKGGARIARVLHLVALCERVEQSCASRPLARERLSSDVQALRQAMQHLERQLESQAARSV